MKRLLSAALYGAAWTATVSAVLWVGIEVWGSAVPPVATSTAEDGWGFRHQRAAQHVLHLSGSPYALGFHNVRLTAPLLNRQEDRLLDGLFAFAPSAAGALLVRKMALGYLVGFDAYLTDRDRQEILGLSEGAPDPFPHLGLRYVRLASYHALHELSHRFGFDNPVFACSLVAVSGTRGKDGHALIARNFDFEGGDIFDKDKIVLAVQPEGRFGFVSVSWAGMAGVVSGINEHGLSIVMNAGASADYRRIGAPTTLLTRHALEEATTVDEAIDIVTAQPRFVSDILGMADAQGDVAVVELTPHSFSVRRGQGLLLATNHMESAALVDDPVNLRRQEQNTTRARHARLTYLTAQSSGPIGEDDLLAFMRDRQGKLGRPLPLAHRHAVDAFIATHSVIMDATAGAIWVSAGPHTVGAYHGYDVKLLLAAKTPAEARAAYLPDLPADQLGSRVIAQLEHSRWGLTQAERAIRARDPVRTEQMLRVASRTLADHPRHLAARGELALLSGEPEWAERFFRQALRAPPEYGTDRARIERLLRETVAPRAAGEVE